MAHHARALEQAELPSRHHVQETTARRRHDTVIWTAQLLPSTNRRRQPIARLTLAQAELRPKIYLALPREVRPLIECLAFEHKGSIGLVATRSGLKRHEGGWALPAGALVYLLGG